MPEEFVITHRVQFSETDLAGVVHFANYFRMMEEVEHAYFRAAGMSVAMSHEGRALGWPRIAVHCEYSGPLRFEDEVRLRFQITKLGDKSLTYEVRFERDGKTVAVGKITSVCCAMGEGGFRAITIPDDIRRRLNGITPSTGTAG